MDRRFDSDTAALKQRIKTSSSALYNLEEWIFQQARLGGDMQVLDLGCGTGKQTFALQKHLSLKSQIIGIDVSEDAVREVNHQAKTMEVENVKAVKCELDNVPDFFENTRFDLILSTYAIYYSNNMVKLISSLSNILNENGQVFICGYGKGTNQEIYGLTNELSISSSKKIAPMNDFISEEEITEVARYYSSHQIVRLANKIVYNSTDNVLTWWMNHNSYISEVEEDLRQSLDNYFRDNEYFSLTKNVLGVLYESKRI